MITTVQCVTKMITLHICAEYPKGHLTRAQSYVFIVAVETIFQHNAVTDPGTTMKNNEIHQRISEVMYLDMLTVKF